MTKNILLFIGAFFIGALITLAIRTAQHDPYESPVTSPVAIEPATEIENTHHHVEVPAATGDKPVNTVCPICGMDVDPEIATALYDGKTVGFGCKNCPPLFAKEPEVFGPAALENKVVE